MRKLLTLSISIFFLTGLLTIPAIYAQSLSEVSLQTSDTNLKTGQQYQIDIILNQPQDTIGTDIVINYESDTLRIDQIDQGQVYPQYPNINLSASQKNIISISGVSEINQPVPATGNFATILFTPINPGNTSMDVSYSTSDTTSSGIILNDDLFSNGISTPPKPIEFQITGDPIIQNTIPTKSKLPNTLTILAGFILTLILIIATIFAFTKLHHKKPSSSPTKIPPPPLFPKK